MKKIVALVLAMVLGISMIGCSSNNSVATVNGEGIPLEYYKIYTNFLKLGTEAQGKDSSYWNEESEYKQDNGNSDNTSSEKNSSGKKTNWEALKLQALKQMEQSEVIYQKAKEDNALPTDEEVKKEVEKFKNDLNSDSTSKELSEKAGFTDEFITYMLTRELVYDTYPKYFIKNTKIDDATLKKEYDDNKEKYNTVTASHILISTKDSKGNDLSKKKKAEAKAKAEEVLKKAKDGEDFAKLAKKYSDDSNAEDGGKLEPFIYSQMVEPFSKAAFKLNKGEISNIVETDFGYHIIKVTDKADTFETAKENVKNMVLSNKYYEELQKAIDNADIKEDDSKIDAFSYK